MLELALHYNKGPIYLKNICKSQDISFKYSGQLIRLLKNANLIRATRGAHGGYFLDRSPEKIKLSEIVIAVEGPLNLVECVKNPDICYRSNSCATRVIWEKISKTCYDTLDSITLKDLVEIHKKMEKV